MSWCLGRNSLWLSTTFLDCFIPSLFVDIYLLFLDSCVTFSNISLMDPLLLTVYQMSSAHVIILNYHLHIKNFQTYLSIPGFSIKLQKLSLVAAGYCHIFPQWSLRNQHTHETYFPHLYHYGFSFLNDDITQLYLEAILTTVSSFSFHLSFILPLFLNTFYVLGVV